MDSAGSIVLSTLITIMGWFGEGLESLQQKDYDDAVKQFTLVYEKKVPGNTVRELALYYRAEAYIGLGEKQKGLGDLILLIRKCSDDVLRAQAMALYKKYGGDRGKLAPLRSPKQVWTDFVAAAKEGDMKKALSYCSGAWRKHVENVTQGNIAQLKQSFGSSPFPVIKETLGKGIKYGMANIAVDIDGQGSQITLLFVLDAKKNCWLINGFRQ